MKKKTRKSKSKKTNKSSLQSSSQSSTKKSISSLYEKLNKVYSFEDLSTKCCRNLTCCKTACPQMNYCEFVSIFDELLKKFKTDEKAEMICSCIEYFFKVEIEKWGLDIFDKPCLLLDEKEKSCKIYKNRPLNCRIYGMWPDEEYTNRVDKFEEAYKKHGIKRDQLPLNCQCPNVKRCNGEKLTMEKISVLFNSLNDIDYTIKDYSTFQIENKENYRSFHDWVLLTTFGENWLSTLTQFMIRSNKETILDQIELIKKVVREKFVINHE